MPDLFAAAYDPIWPTAPDVALAEETLLQAGYRARGDARLDVGISFSEPTYGNFMAGAVALMDRRSRRNAVRESRRVPGHRHVHLHADDRPRRDRVRHLRLDADRPAPGSLFRSAGTLGQPDPRNGRYTNPAINALLDQAAALDDPAAQGELYRAASRLLLEDYALIPLWQDHIVLVAWDTVEGSRSTPAGSCTMSDSHAGRREAGGQKKRGPPQGDPPLA
ncbi:MAG: hypothetical protein M5U19_13450 [Microthrixaceae bacterium]|nr:hypothetical protein [Microthrixaceae bacterium]